MIISITTQIQLQFFIIFFKYKITILLILEF